MMPRTVPWAVVVVAMAVLTAQAADDLKTLTLACRLAVDNGKAAPAAQVTAATEVVAKRFRAGGWGDVQVAESPIMPGQLKIALPPMEAALVAEKAKEAWSLLERPGVVEFRMWVDRFEEQAERRRRTEAGAGYVCDVGLAWVPRVEGGPDMLLRIPEGAARARMDKLKSEGVGENDPGFVEARAAFDKVVRERVFTSAQLARVELQTRPHVGHVIAYELQPDRKAAFEALPTWVVVVDGKVCSAQLANVAKPGVRIIEGSGPTGFTEREARFLVAVMQSGPLPVRLIREYEDTK
jgi:preprotein translocase subunit SecD